MLQETMLPNGVRVITYYAPHVNSASIEFFTMSGSRFDPEGLDGLAHFVEHAVFKGSESWPSAKLVSDELLAVGGSYNAHTSKDVMTFDVCVPLDHWRRALSVLFDVVRRPLLEQESIDIERKVIFNEISAFLDDTDEYALSCLYDMAWPNHGMGREILGSEETVSAITPDDIWSFMRGQICPPNFIVMVGGRVDHDEVVDAVNELTFDWQSGSPQLLDMPGPWRDRAGLGHQQVSGFRQGAFVFGFEGFPMKTRESMMMGLITEALAGVAFGSMHYALREREGLVYALEGSIHGYADCGMSVITCSADPKNAKQLLSLFFNEVNKFCEEVTEADIDRVKALICGGLSVGVETVEDYLDWYGYQAIYGRQLLSVNDATAVYNSMTLDEVRSMALARFQPSRMRMFYCGAGRVQPVMEKALDRQLEYWYPARRGYLPEFRTVQRYR